MEIILSNVWKRYDSSWIIKDLNCNIYPKDRLAIQGPNGSGKSTLIHLISGMLPMSKGQIKYQVNGQDIDNNEIYKYCSISAAYAELDLEMTILELYNHYKLYKPLIINDLDEFLDYCLLTKEKSKIIKTLSSGMKQRLNLALILNFDVPLLLLDEPSSFLDADKKSWFNRHLEKMTKNKAVIIASNDDEDLHSCNKQLVLA